MEIPLFDIDLTLCRLKAGRNVAMDAFDFAFKEVYGVNASQTEIVTHGMIDPQIMVEVLRLHNFRSEQIEEKMEVAMGVMVDYFMAHQGEGEYEALPYAREILEELKERNIPRGVLTGNIEATAWKKLEEIGLSDLIQFGAFGNLARKRVDLIGVAAERAKQAGIELVGNKLCIVGDALLDVRTAKQGKIKSVAVATGGFSLDELIAEGPELAIKSFAQEVDRNRFIDFLTKL